MLSPVEVAAGHVRVGRPQDLAVAVAEGVPDGQALALVLVGALHLRPAGGGGCRGEMMFRSHQERRRAGQGRVEGRDRTMRDERESDDAAGRKLLTLSSGLSEMEGTKATRGKAVRCAFSLLDSSCAAPPPPSPRQRAHLVCAGGAAPHEAAGEFADGRLPLRGGRGDHAHAHCRHRAAAGQGWAPAGERGRLRPEPFCCRCCWGCPAGAAAPWAPPLPLPLPLVPLTQAPAPPRFPAAAHLLPPPPPRHGSWLWVCLPWRHPGQRGWAPCAQRSRTGPC